MNELVKMAMVALYPRTATLPGLAELDIDDKVAALRRESTLLFWTGIVFASIVFQLSPILTVRRPWPAAFLSEDELDRHAHGLATHPFYFLRQLINLLKIMGGALWGASPEVRASIHLPAYGVDPKTRRLGIVKSSTLVVPRAPVDALVELGRVELARGRHGHRSVSAEADAPKVAS
jgi:hypothetical protein